MKRIAIIVFFAISSILFADPITITEDGQTISFELVNEKKAQKLRQLYESRYSYVYIIDSIEIDALFAGKDSNSKDLNKMERDFFNQINNIPKGKYKVATISMSLQSSLLLGFMYFGNDYFFMVLFTNTWDKEFINLRYDRERYDIIFNNTWKMLF
jgi:hypothetical protein